MKELIETIQLSNDKSSYLIELLKHDSGIKYVRIEHILQKERCSINISPNVLNDLIEVLSNYKRKIDRNLTIVDTNNEKIPLDIRDKAELVQNRYLRGVQISDLAIQFDCDESLIEMILENKGIEIVSNKLPKNWNWRNKSKRKR